MKIALPSPLSPSNSFLRQWTGPLTEDLVLHPADFGLGQVPARMKPAATTRSVCGFCSTGCSLDIHLKDGVAVGLSPTTDYPVNLGMACPKGWESLAPLSATDRATTPLIRGAEGRFAPASWDQAMRLFTAKFKEIMARHGNESVAFLSTGQICTEEMALLGALFKFGMGGLHCDSNTRQCMATAHVAYKESFGFDAPPFTYADFEESDVLVFIGSNLCIAHPIMWQRVRRNQNHHGAARPAKSKPSQNHRRGSTPHRDGDERHAAPGTQTEVRSDAALWCRQPAGAKRLGRSRLHRAQHDRIQRVRRIRAAVYAGQGGG